MAANVFAKAGARVWDLDDAVRQQWQAIARDTRWKEYAPRSQPCASQLKTAQKLA